MRGFFLEIRGFNAKRIQCRPGDVLRCQPRIGIHVAWARHRSMNRFGRVMVRTARSPRSRYPEAAKWCKTSPKPKAELCPITIRT